MILTGSKIKEEVEAGTIVLKPFSADQVNPNSYNYRLGSVLKVFAGFDGEKSIFTSIKIPENGYILYPQQMYLGHTFEVIGSNTYAMSLIGRSSLGRLGLFLQLSANLGHTNSVHRWTLELFSAKPIRLYPKMIIGQVSFWTNQGDPMPYAGIYGGFSHPQTSLYNHKTDPS